MMKAGVILKLAELQPGNPFWAHDQSVRVMGL